MIGRVALIVAALAAGGAQAGLLQAQGRPLSASGTKNLTFGTLFPGVPQPILRTDAVNAGSFELRGRNRAEIRIDFTLPAALTGPAAATMPLSFGAGDGGHNTQNTIGTAQAFDPRAPLIAQLATNGRLYVWLGGTALPTGTQRSGNYTASVTLTASYTGN